MSISDFVVFYCFAALRETEVNKQFATQTGKAKKRRYFRRFFACAPIKSHSSQFVKIIQLSQTGKAKSRRYFRRFFACAPIKNHSSQFVKIIQLSQTGKAKSRVEGNFKNGLLLVYLIYSASIAERLFIAVIGETFSTTTPCGTESISPV
jgi:hypothetical protein